nr:MAG TPA: hypothetical protein [Caudoviricetes sp.]
MVLLVVGSSPIHHPNILLIPMMKGCLALKR